MKKKDSISEKTSVTIYDVAKTSGTSPATVSRVLNQHDQINEKTRMKVLNAIDKIGYNKSIAGKRKISATFKKRRNINVELLLCPLREQHDILSLGYFNDVLYGIQTCLGETGTATLQLSTWLADSERFKDLNEQTFKRLINADGILITGHPSPELLDRIMALDKPVVMASIENDKKLINNVVLDNFSAGVAAADYLIDSGHKRIHFLSGPDLIKSWEKRKAGVMMQTINRLGFECFSSQNAKSTDNADIADELRGWLDTIELPVAVVIPAPTAFLAVERVLMEKGLSCPGDVSVVSFDGKHCGASKLKLTNFQTFPKKIGYKVAKRLLQLLDNPEPQKMSHTIVVPTQLVVGDSVKVLTDK